jgi:deferrochelatase/peroxidase EfeB
MIICKESGSPLAKFPHGDPDLPSRFDDNKGYRRLNDPRGEKTPRFAHIRKVYPRDDGMSDDPEDLVFCKFQKLQISGFNMITWYLIFR